MHFLTFTVIEVRKSIQTDLIIPRGLALLDIDNINPKINRKDPNRKPQNIISKSQIKTKKGKKEREQRDQPEKNKQLSVDETLDQSKLLLEIAMMEELNRSDTKNKGILSTVKPPLRRTSEGKTSTEFEESTTHQHGQTNPATEVI